MNFEQVERGLEQLRSRLRDGHFLVGGWLQIPSPISARIIAENEVDWVVVDREHGSIGVSDAAVLNQSIMCAGKLPFCRLACPENHELKLALEAGAYGIVIPNVKSAENLEELIHGCQYPPFGERGVGYSAGNRFGRDLDQILIKRFRPFVVAMIENKEAVQDLDQILKIPGLDAIFVGPYDLSASLGVCGQFDASEFQDALKIVLTKARALGIPSGIHVVSPNIDELKLRISEGFQFIAYSVDSVLLNFNLNLGEVK